MGNSCMKSKNVVEVKSPTLPAFKIVVVGDSGSGKTSIIRRYIENRFETQYERTTDVGITSVVKKLNVPDQAIVSVELWDVPGQNDVDLRKTYYLDVDAVIVVVDISQEDSLKVAGSWSLDVVNHARISRTFIENIPNPDGKTFAQKKRKEYLKPNVGGIPILLLGNKYDLAKSKFVREFEMSDQLTDSTNKIQDSEITHPSSLQDQSQTEEPKSEKNSGSKNRTKSVDNSNLDKQNTNGSRPVDVGSGESRNSKDSQSSSKPEESNLNAKESQDSAKEPSKLKETHDSQNVSKPEESESSNGPTQTSVSTSVQGFSNGVDNHSIANGSQPTVNSLGDENSNEMNGNVGSIEQATDTSLLKKIHPREVTAIQNKSLVGSAITVTTSVNSILPPCVEEIESIAENFGFIAGVPVSARTPNGGVQDAIQSILRRLVAKKLLNIDAKDGKNTDMTSNKSSKISNGKISTNSRKKLPGLSESLQEVGIIEIDEIIRRCNSTLQEAEDMSTGYAEALQSFKMVCYQNGVVGTTRSTLEGCITGLKEMVAMDHETTITDDPRENVKLLLMTPEKQKEQEDEALSLVVADKEGFPDFQIINSKQEDVELNPVEGTQPSAQVMNVIKEYRGKLLVKSVSVLKHGDEVEALLGRHFDELADQEEKAWEISVAAGLSPDDVRRILSIIAQDKARLRGTRELIRETKRSVQTSIGKIKAALLF